MASAATSPSIAEAVDAANIPTLLMVLVQLTGELRWLDDRYRPTSARGVDDNDTGGLSDNGWYRTLARPDVDLVSTRIFLSTVRVVGRRGLTLEEAWEGVNATAYLGTVVPGFPNFLTLFRPNVQTGHGGSLITLVEAQMDYVMSALHVMRAERDLAQGGVGVVSEFSVPALSV